MIDILTYISIFSGGFLLLLMLLSLLGGLDLDVDFDHGGDTDAGGFGLMKTVLTFVSVAAWVGKVVIATTQNPTIALLSAIVSGILAVFILSTVLKALLRNQKFVDTSVDIAVGKTGKVYLKIPQNGNGIVQVKINDAVRDIKAKTDSGEDLATGTAVFIEDYRDGYLIVSRLK